MNISFEIRTYEGDELIVSLSSSYDFVKELVGSRGLPDIEIIDMSIVRKSGHSRVSIMALREIVTRVADIISSSPDSVLFYLCDPVEPIPNSRPTRCGLCQQYRDRLFSLMFERFGQESGVGWYDHRIVADIHGEPQFAHLIFREDHKEAISLLVEEAQSIFGIMDAEK